MWNETNPATLYLGTTWELLPVDKYIRTGNTALQTGGNNSVSIGKENLPNVKLKVDTFSLTTAKHKHKTIDLDYAWIEHVGGGGFGAGWDAHTSKPSVYRYTSLDGGENTGTASPNTETLGSGTALNIQPEYITLKFWKRLS